MLGQRYSYALNKDEYRLSQMFFMWKNVFSVQVCIYKADARYWCSACVGTLEVVYKSIVLPEQHNSKMGIWRYGEALPLKKVGAPVTMGEDNTPLILAEKLGEILGHKYLYIKNEGLNHTLSFKDRAMSPAVTKAMEFNLKRIVSASASMRQGPDRNVLYIFLLLPQQERKDCLNIMAQS